MANRSVGLGSGALLAATMLAAPAAALGASESFNTDFSFQLERPIQTVAHLQAVAVTPGDPINTFMGSTTVQLPEFDDQGGTRLLQEVRLNLSMDISGEILLLVNDPIYLAQFHTPAVLVDNNQVVAHLDGSAGVHGLLAEADFADPTFELPNTLPTTTLVDDRLPVNASGQGSDSTTASSDLLDFVGTGSLDIDLLASLFAEYFPGAAGFTDGFEATGTVEIVYVYDTPETTPTDPNTVPSPAAAGLGLVLLGGYAARRRR